MAPIITYANILWQAIVAPGIAAVKLPCLVQWFAASAKKEMPRNWGEVCGPYSAMRMSLRRIGWSWQSLAVFTDHKGNQHNISAICPNMLSSLLRSAWHARLAKIASAKRLPPPPEQTTAVDGVEERVSTPMHTIPLDLHHVKLLLHGKKHGEPLLDPLQASCMQHFVLDGDVDPSSPVQSRI